MMDSNSRAASTKTGRLFELGFERILKTNSGIFVETITERPFVVVGRLRFNSTNT